MMKESIFILASLITANAVYGQKTEEQKQQRIPSRVATCNETAKKVEEARAVGSSSISSEVQKQLQECNALKLSAKTQNADFQDEATSYASGDGRFTCYKKAGYTLDYQDCKSTLDYYSAAIAAEKLMQLQQGVRSSISNKNIADEVNQKTQEGDVQNATINAVKKTNQNLAGMYTEQTAMYSAAVLALSSKLINWQGQGAKSIQKLCKNDLGCVKQVNIAISTAKDDMFANTGTKAGLIVALNEFIAKGGAALRNRVAAQNNAAAANASLENTAADTDLMLDKCVVNPAAADCVKQGNRVSGGDFTAGSFSVGDGVGNNSFNMGTGTDSFGEPGAETKIPDSENVASVTSPFEDQAKEAKGILNPAAAASFTPGAAPGGGGGGGAGGGMGGGSAALGDDLKGDNGEANKEPEIKTGKLSGGYDSKGGEAFRAVASSKDEENPFSSLFNQNSEETNGGIEEYPDITPEAGLGLFDKISSRYGKVLDRIESNNLE